MKIYVISANETIYNLQIKNEDSALQLSDTFKNIKDRHINTARESTEYALENTKSETNCLLHYYFENNSDYIRKNLFDIFMKMDKEEYDQILDNYFYYYSLPDSVDRNIYLNIEDLKTKINDTINKLQKDTLNNDTNKIRIKSLQKDLKECIKHKNPISIKYLIVTFDNLICIQIKDRGKAIQQDFMGIFKSEKSTHFTTANNIITLKPYFDAIIELNHEENQHKISFRQAFDFGLFNTKLIIPTRHTPEELASFIKGNVYLRDNIIQVDSLVHLNKLNTKARKNLDNFTKIKEESVLQGRLEYAKLNHPNNICTDSGKLRLTGMVEQDQNMLKDLMDKMPKEAVVEFAKNYNKK